MAWACFQKLAVGKAQKCTKNDITSNSEWPTVNLNLISWQNMAKLAVSVNCMTPVGFLNVKKCVELIKVHEKSALSINIIHKMAYHIIFVEFRIIFHHFSTVTRPVLPILWTIWNEKTLFPCNLRCWIYFWTCHKVLGPVNRLKWTKYEKTLKFLSTISTPDGPFVQFFA